MSGEDLDGTPEEDALDLAALLGEAQYEPPPAARRNFKPWHEPRKQYVREYQWLEYTLQLLSDLPEGRPLHYLGLPGQDLLDIRLLHEHVCDERPLRFFGFNTQLDDTILGSSRQQVMALDGIEPSSDITGDDFYQLSDPASVAYTKTKARAPFDLVNLDFCDSALKDAVTNDSLYAAVEQLLFMQRGRDEPWLLLVTTRVDRDRMHEDVLGKLDGLLAENLQNEKFEAAYSPPLDGGDGSLSGCADQHRLYVICVALAKWILMAARDQRSSVTLESAMSYRVNPGPGEDDMLSVALKITPPGGPAAVGLVNHAGGQAHDEAKWAVKFPGVAERRVAVDRELKQDPQTARSMQDAAKKLLVSASYDVSGYDAWLARRENHRDEGAAS